MHSLKSSGDSIAQEFSKLMGKGKLVKSAQLTNLDPDAGFEGTEGDGDFSDDSLDAMFNASDDQEDHAESPGEGAIDSAVDQIDSAYDGSKWAPKRDHAHDSIASERKVLAGLSKIEGSLRAKGEAFAADVVEATAISIKGDLRKEAGRKSAIVSGLKKIAEELYRSNDPLAGDMVQVTINKLGGSDDAFKGLEDELEKKGPSEQDQLIQLLCADDPRGQKMRADFTEGAKTDPTKALLMMQSKQKCPSMWT